MLIMLRIRSRVRAMSAVERTHRVYMVARARAPVHLLLTSYAQAPLAPGTLACGVDKDYARSMPWLLSSGIRADVLWATT